MEVIPALVNCLAAVIIAVAAIYGISAWKREFRGKCQIELAEGVLALFYEVRDAIAGMRNPFGFEGESSTRKVQPNETEAQKRARDRASVMFKRYNDREKIFSRLYSLRYRFMAQFGKEKVEPFDRIHKVVIELFSAAHTLTDLWALRTEHYPEERQETTQEDIRKYEKIFWWSGSKDEVAERVDEAVSNIEQICSTVIMGQQAKRQT